MVPFQMVVPVSNGSKCFGVVSSGVVCYVLSLSLRVAVLLSHRWLFASTRDDSVRPRLNMTAT